LGIASPDLMPANRIVLADEEKGLIVD